MEPPPSKPRICRQRGMRALGDADLGTHMFSHMTARLHKRDASTLSWSKKHQRLNCPCSTITPCSAMLTVAESTWSQMQEVTAAAMLHILTGQSCLYRKQNHLNHSVRCGGMLCGKLSPPQPSASSISVFWNVPLTTVLQIPHLSFYFFILIKYTFHSLPPDCLLWFSSRIPGSILSPPKLS